MKLVVICSSCFLLLSSAVAAIYQWVDDSGVVHYTDNPHDNAKMIVLPPIDKHVSKIITADKNLISTPAAVNVPHYVVTILQPRQQESVRNNLGDLVVLLDIQPQLSPTHKLQLFLDEKAVADPSMTTTYLLHKVDRGTHVLSAIVTDQQKHEITRSRDVTFYMLRAIVKSPKLSNSVDTP
ncbi:MAG: DUF4124 domain-containing protein [Legionella sp.]